LMITSKNLLAPSSGEPIVTPTQDMILWVYYITAIDEKGIWAGKIFTDIYSVELAYEAWVLWIKSPIKVRVDNKIIETSYWRLLFNEIIPKWLGFVNETLRKWVVKKLLARSFEEFGSETTAKFVDEIKNFWYKYSTISGLSISKDDMIIPDNKEKLLAEASEKVKAIQKKHWEWYMTEDEKYNQSIKVWADVKKVIEWELKELFLPDNHVFNFIDSWARWNRWNITQLCWMKWLVAGTTGKTIELPIKSTLKEWFSTLEYFIATHWWRKGKSDTALKTAQSGYLTRRLVDSSQNILIKEDDCHTVHYKTIIRWEKTGSFEEKFDEKIFWNTLASDILGEDWKILVEAWTIINTKILDIVDINNVNEVRVRSVLTCETEWWVCKACYWLDLWLDKPVEIWTPVWVIAAQSIWEPWTQLTMRTFHSGWVVKEGWDMAQGLSRVEELFEARIPKVVAEIADSDWIVKVEQTPTNIIVRVIADKLYTEEYYYEDNFNITVKTGQIVKAKQILAKSTIDKQKVVATYPWEIKKIGNGVIEIQDVEERVFEYTFDLGRRILVKDGDKIEKWQKITEWYLNVHKLKDIVWILETEQYIVDEIKAVYASQWQTVNSKHIELIVRQMFSRVRIISKWDTDFFPWDIIDIIKYKKENAKLIKEEKKASIWERLLLWITKISLYTESWLSAASFQETVRVLVESSVAGKIDKFKEMKENVIIWRLVPAWRQYRKIHNQSLEEDYSDGEYFDPDNDNVDVSDEQIEKVINEMERESNF
jgi:DNA-directed RNA polymerase subunit beta'